MSFNQKLAGASRRNNSLLCVGLDPDPRKMPVKSAVEFCTAIIDATKDLVCCYKPNFAFFEQLGLDAFEQLYAVRRAIPDHIPVIGDAKRGDIGNTAEAYARALFDVLDFDAVTISPYLGRDAVLPFLADPNRTALILCRTSNPGGQDVQGLQVDWQGGSAPLYQVIAHRTREWNTNGNAGLVVGATYPEELGQVRGICPDQPILVPGIGAQGGDLLASVAAGLGGEPSQLIISASRQVLYASSGTDYPSAARAAAEQLRADIQAAMKAAARNS